MKELFKTADLSQAQVARRLGVDKSLITRWINGSRSPSDEQVEKMAEMLGVTAEEIKARLQK